MRIPRRTKIVATLGPATNDLESICALVDAGLDVARINASHGDHESQRRSFEMVREAAQRAGRPVGILYDLQGPKIRVGRFAGDPRRVAAGDELRLAVGRPPEGEELPSDYALLDQDVQVGQPLLIDDGSIAAEVVDVRPGLVCCRILNDGVILPRKGINLPHTRVSAPALTEKDKVDALFAAELGVDLIALSFVRRGEDVHALQALLEERGSSIPVVAKIEKPQALENLDEILEAAWGVMVARGDLGVELSPEDVPMAQKRIIRSANLLGKPVITATQMLDSMTRSPRPTRAEASDVANAVLDGTDAVMLSGETAVGAYAKESVAMMARIIAATERMQPPEPMRRRRERHITSIAEATADASVQVAHHTDARAVVAFTRTGRSAILVSERRPRAPLLAFTPEESTRNRLTVVWGVQPYLLPNTVTVDERVRLLDKAVVQEGVASAGDVLVLCMAAPTASAGSTNIMMVHRVGATVVPELTRAHP